MPRHGGGAQTLYYCISVLPVVHFFDTLTQPQHRDLSSRHSYQVIILARHTLPFSSLPLNVLCVERTNSSPCTSHPIPSLARLSTSTHLLLYILVLNSDYQKARTTSHHNYSRNREARYICPLSPPANPLPAFGSLQASRR